MPSARLLLAPLLAAVAAAAPARALETISHQSKECIDGKTHSLSYKATQVAGDSFVDLDGDLKDMLDSVDCDIDHTQLTLNFKHDADAAEWLIKFHDFNDHFIVGGDSWNCSVLAPTANRPSFILRRVVGSSFSLDHMKHLSVSTALARYDEVFESADVSYGVLDDGCAAATSFAAGQTATKHICLGYNTDCHGSAKQELPLYSATTKSGAKLSATCTDCWAALSADVFVDISIRDFKLQSLSGGFQNVNLNASMVVEAEATGNWNTAFDKTYPLVATQYLLNFKVGAVPFMLWFDVPMEVKAELTFEEDASLTLGALASVALGDAFVEWTPATHWKHTTMKPVFSFSPQLSSKDQADVQGSFSIVPSFDLYFDRIFSYSLTATGQLDADVSLAGKQLCEKSTYDLELSTKAELDINIPIVDFHKDWTWGPITVGSWTGQPVKPACVNL